jgi:pimeloyl-ACP methyl ester carboxylesterase
MTDRTTVRNGDTHLSVLVTGQPDGPTVLLSNSLGAGLHMWDPQRDLLNPHFRVIGYDTRGHGKSGTPSGSYSFGDLTADAIAILDHFEAERADIIGLSLGGMTALGLGLDYPDRVGRIVCACARADAPQPFVTSWDDRIAAITAGGMSAIWQGTLDRWLTRDVMFEIFNYPFNRLGKNAVFTRIGIENAQLGRIYKWYGFTEHEVPHMRGPDQSEFVYVLTKEAWLNNGKHKGKHHV